MNTALTTVSAKPILAADLGKYKSGTWLHESATVRTALRPRRHRNPFFIKPCNDHEDCMLVQLHR